MCKFCRTQDTDTKGQTRFPYLHTTIPFPMTAHKTLYTPTHSLQISSFQHSSGRHTQRVHSASPYTQKYKNFSIHCVKKVFLFAFIFVVCFKIRSVSFRITSTNELHSMGVYRWIICCKHGFLTHEVSCIHKDGPNPYTDTHQFSTVHITSRTSA